MLPERILVVDDEPAVADLIAMVVEQEGRQAVVARSGGEALRLLADGPVVDGVFLDVAMPDLSGLEVLTEIRRRFPALRVIILSGHADDDVVREARRLGAVDVVRKPASIATLVTAIGRLRP